MIKESDKDQKVFDFIVCHSEDIDSLNAVHGLILQADEKLNGKVPNACILFSAIDYDHQLILNEINNKWPGIQLVGGTTDGELSSELGFSEDSVVMILFRSGSVIFTSGVGDLRSAGTEAACNKAVSEASENLIQTPKLCLTFPGGVGTNNDKIVASLANLFDGEVPIFGGIPADQWRFKVQYQFCGNKVFTDSVPILLFSGDFKFEYGVDSGWIPMGEPGIANKIEGNIIYEINNEPAIQFYKSGLGELTDPSGEFPLVILNKENEILYQRTPARVLSDNSGAIGFLGEIPSGSIVQIATAERDTILDGSRKSVHLAFDKFTMGSKISGGLFISCAARKALLGTRTREEIEIAREILGEDIPVAGFYGYGELSPLNNDKSNSLLHNQTFITILFGSK